MSHPHSHEHHHGHVQAANITSLQLWIATSLTFLFCLVEAGVGYFANSLALMADAGHNFADALALALSAFAIWIASKPADGRRTFGYHRVAILAALANAIGLMVMAGAIFWTAVQRLSVPPSVQSEPMIWMALAAIVLNAGIAWWLSKAAKEDLNIRGAYLHMLGDAAASLGVVVAGVIIAITGLYIADPIVSILFSLLVLWSSWGIFTESIDVLLEAAPTKLDLVKIEQHIRNIEGVLDIHDLHVWTVSSGMIASSCHIRVIDQPVSASQKIYENVAHMLADNFKISHSTIQIETEYCGGHTHEARSTETHNEHAH